MLKLKLQLNNPSTYAVLLLFILLLLVLGWATERWTTTETEEGFSLYSMLNFSNQPSKKLPPVFGVGDNYSYQTEPARGKKYVKPDKATPRTLYYVNSEIEIWSPKTVHEFLEFQARENPDVIFDMDIVQQQATEEEAKELLENGVWSWSDRTKEIYADVISRSNYTKKSAMKGIETDQTIYNERVMLQMLGLNEAEGKFLLYGRMIPDRPRLNKYISSGQGTYGVTSGLEDNDVYMNRLKCEKDKIKLQKFVGYNKGITAEPMYKSTDVDYSQLPALYDGFQFIEQPCDPCKALAFPYDTSCPFSVKPDKKVSPAWEKIWGLPASPIPELPKEFPYWMN